MNEEIKNYGRPMYMKEKADIIALTKKHRKKKQKCILKC